MKIKLMIDSAADAPAELVVKNNITVVPLSVNFGDKSYKDQVEINPRDFFKKLETTTEHPTTSQVSPGDFLTAFEEALKDYDHILYISLSSKVSGTHSGALMAKEMLGNDRITIVDSKTASAGIALLAKKASEDIQAGKSIQEITENIKINREKLRTYVFVDTFKYLEKGGRVNKGKAIIGGLLNIKPVLTVTDGEINLVDKPRGRKKALNKIVDHIKEDRHMINKEEVMFHIGADENLFYYLKEKTEDVIQFEKVSTSEVGSIIGTHTGPNVVAVTYFTK